MIHLTENDSMVFCGALFIKHPESLAQAAESKETYLVVEITPTTTMLADRRQFLKIIERGKFKENDQEALRLLEAYFRDKKMRSFADWAPVYSFTSEVPSAPKAKGPYW